MSKDKKEEPPVGEDASKTETEELPTLELLSAAPGEGVSSQVEMPSRTDVRVDEAHIPAEEATVVEVKSKAIDTAQPAETSVEATPPVVASMNETATEELPTAAKQEPEAGMTETSEPPTDEEPQLTKETPAESELEITETKESTTLESVDPPEVSPSAAASVKSKAVIALNINSAEGSMMYEKDGDWELEPDTMFPNSSATRGGNAGVNATFDGSGASTMYENETWVLEPDPNNATGNGPVAFKPLASTLLTSKPLASETESTMYENESWVLDPDPESVLKLSGTNSKAASRNLVSWNSSTAASSKNLAEATGLSTKSSTKSNTAEAPNGNPMEDECCASGLAARNGNNNALPASYCDDYNSAVENDLGLVWSWVYNLVTSVVEIVEEFRNSELCKK